MFGCHLFGTDLCGTPCSIWFTTIRLLRCRAARGAVVSNIGSPFQRTTLLFELQTPVTSTSRASEPAYFHGRASWDLPTRTALRPMVGMGADCSLPSSSSAGPSETV